MDSNTDDRRNLLDRIPRGIGLVGLIRWAWRSWATRSLAIGALATMIDVSVLLVCVKKLGLPNPVGAMCGVCVGATFTFFANKAFAFRDQSNAGPQVLKFVLSTAGAMGIHAGLVWWLADRLHVPVVAAKLAADVVVFSVGQLFLLRFWVFRDSSPQHERKPAARAPAKLERLRENRETS